MNAASFDYAALNARLAKSKFRMRFRLSEAECAALAGLGKEKLRAQTPENFADAACRGSSLSRRQSDADARFRRLCRPARDGVLLPPLSA